MGQYSSAVEVPVPYLGSVISTSQVW